MGAILDDLDLGYLSNIVSRAGVVEILGCSCLELTILEQILLEKLGGELCSLGV